MELLLDTELLLDIELLLETELDELLVELPLLLLLLRELLELLTDDLLEVLLVLESELEDLELEELIFCAYPALRLISLPIPACA